MPHLVKMFDDQVVDLDDVHSLSLLYEDFVKPFTDVLVFDLVYKVGTQFPKTQIVVDSCAYVKRNLLNEENIKKYNDFKNYFLEVKNNKTINKIFK